MEKNKTDKDRADRRLLPAAIIISALLAAGLLTALVLGLFRGVSAVAVMVLVLALVGVGAGLLSGGWWNKVHKESRGGGKEQFPAPSYQERLERLRTLYDRRLLTKEEYESKRKEIIEKMTKEL